MAIVYPLSLPNQRFRTYGWRERDVTADVASPFTGQSQVIVWAGQWVECTLTLTVMNRAAAQVWDAWLTSLAGHAGTFLLGPPGRSAPLGTAASAPGTPLVRGAGQTGNVLSIDGLPANAPATSRPATTDISSAAARRRASTRRSRTWAATAPARPTSQSGLACAVRRPTTIAVVVSGAKGLFHRMSNVTEWSVGVDGLTAMRSFDAKEKL
jgi:hypothetical protein